MTSIQGLIFRQLVRWTAPDFDHRRSVDAVRAELVAAARAGKPPQDVEMTPTAAGERRAVWITPQHASSDAVMLYLHGGAYIAGGIDTHAHWVAYLAKAAGLRALLVEYRLAPEHPFPAALDDAVQSYHWLLKRGISPEQIIVAGDSAGGGLTLTTLIRLRDEGAPLPAAAVCISPWTDLKATGESLRTHNRADPWLRAESIIPGAAHYHGSMPPDHPLISPLYADVHDLPPVLIHVGECEILLSDALRMAAKLRTAGNDIQLTVWSGMWHVFHAFGFAMPESRQAIMEIAQFVQHQLRKRSI